MKLSAILLVLVMHLLSSCSSPQLIVKPISSNKETAFEVSTKNINGLLDIHFWEGRYLWTGKPDNSLWRASLDYYPGPTITYGLVPRDFTTLNGNNGSGRSKSGEAKPLPRNTKIYMEIGYQYDEFISASAGSKAFSFKLNKNGDITDFREEAPYYIEIPNPNKKQQNQ